MPISTSRTPESAIKKEDTKQENADIALIFIVLS